MLEALAVIFAAFLEYPLAYFPVPALIVALPLIAIFGRRGRRRLYCIAALLFPWAGFLVGGALWGLAGEDCRIDFKYYNGSCRLAGLELHDVITGLTFMWGFIAIWLCTPLILLLSVWEGVARYLRRRNQSR